MNSSKAQMRINHCCNLILLVGLALSACGPATPKIASLSSPSASITPQPSSTATDSLVSTQTLTATVSPTFTVSPTVTPAHPLSMEYLKQQSYSGELMIEEDLGQEDSYYRYIVSYHSDGYKNYALLTVPIGDVPETGWPIIVFNHGHIPPKVYRTTQGYEAYVHAFADNGYIVLRPDYRGHGNSEGEPRNTYFHPGNTIDVLNAVAAVKKWETADPNRIGMWGHSMGGWISLRAMIIDPNIRVGVIWAGVIGSYDDLCVHWFNCENWDAETWSFWSETPFAEYGLPEENEAFWAAASMDTYLPDLEGVVQLHHATTDGVVPVALSRVMYEKMIADGIAVEFYEYPQDDHNISQNFELAIRRTLDFFDIHLKGTGGGGR